MKKLSKILLISLLAVFLAVGSASAIAYLRISDGVTTITIQDDDLNDAFVGEGVVGYTGSFGGVWSVNALFGATKPQTGVEPTEPVMSFSSDILGGPGILTVSFSDTNWEGSDNLIHFTNEIGGDTECIVSATSYYDLGNVEFAETEELLNLGTHGPGSFSRFEETDPDLILASPYSVTMVFEITHGSPADYTSIDNLVTGSVPEPCEGGDTDGDGICNADDNCPSDANADQTDTDGDGAGNTCDFCPSDPENDADEDGFCESDDNCPLVANSDQTDTDGDSLGNACDDDDDNDGVFDETDNCPLMGNKDQADIDGDGAGDVCDADSDNDGFLDANDQCPYTPLGNVVDYTGCSIADLCPCDNQWKNHGAYVKCVAHSSEDFVSEGFITELQKDDIVSNAAQSECGHKK